MAENQTASPESLAERLTRAARAASEIVAQAPGRVKNNVLREFARLLEDRRKEIFEANGADRAAAEDAGLRPVLVKRLVFGAEKLEGRVRALHEIISLPDPVGTADFCVTRPRGLEVKRVRVPLGVIAAVYEARPHVTVNVGALGLKAGNTVILRGGAETIRTNTCLGRIWQEALELAGLPRAAVQVVSHTDREVTKALVRQEGGIDLLLARGGKGLQAFIAENARVPVLKHLHGVCHVYVDVTADPGVACQVVKDSKVLMPEVCNAAETLLVDAAGAERILPELGRVLQQEGVVIRACPRARAYLPWAEPADEEDWSTEYLDLVLAVKLVDGVEEAVAHINRYGSHHTDAIVSQNYTAIRTFTARVDSGVVLVNASTMFNDGGELGLGAEVGISTDRLHARGPVGLYDLTTYKYVVYGEGEILGSS